MMNRNESQLVLHDIPIFLWFFGLVFAGFGAFMLRPDQVNELTALGVALVKSQSSSRDSVSSSH